MEHATLAQLVEQLTCGRNKIYFELSCTFIRKLIKWTSLIRGRLNKKLYVNPELEKYFSSVETLYDVPKVLNYGKEKVQTANIIILWQ